MSLADVKTRIKVQMEAVSGIGFVYTRQRNLSAEKDQAFLVKGGRLHVWMMRREASQLTDQVVNQNFVEQADTLVIEGFYAVRDEDDSDAAFDAVIDSILQALNTDRRPPSHFNGTTRTARPPQLRSKNLVMFGQSQVLCHHAEISIQFVPQYLQ